MDLQISEGSDGQFEIRFTSPYAFGDLVEFHSINGQGSGRVSDIVLQEDGTYYYYITRDDGEIHPGVYADEMLLIEKAVIDGGRSQ